MLYLEDLTEKIIGAAIEVHRILGPGLLESAYQECLARELTLREMPFAKEKILPVTYKGVQVDCGYRMDFLIDHQVVIELKAVEVVHPIHKAQPINYLKLTGCKVGLIINFNVEQLTKGVIRLAN